MGIITRKTCRLCGSSDIHTVFSLGNLYISNFVDSNQEGQKAPLEMFLCKNCSLLQLKHTAPQEFMYTSTTAIY